MRLIVALLTLSALHAAISFPVNQHAGDLSSWTHRSRWSKTIFSSISIGDGSIGEQRNHMNSYIDQFLGKRGKTKNTFLIALPCESCHELQIQLESVQRAIVYNCPVAMHACIPTSITKVPLMTVSGNITVDQLRCIIEKTVQDNYDEMISLQFAGLDIEAGDLSNNEVLYATVSDKQVQQGAEEIENSSIRQLADRLNHCIVDETSCATSVSNIFRVPFMKLPPDWNELVASQNATAINFTPEYGGNGISPLHWIDWSEDSFGEPQRMREIGLYSEQGKFPIVTIQFPGRVLRNANEMKWERYQDERMKEVERKLRDDVGSSKEGSNDELMMKLTRERLEKLFEHGGIQEESLTSRTSQPNEAGKISSSSKKEEDWLDIQDELLEDPQRKIDSDAINEWTRQRIRNIIETKSIAKAANLAKKDMPPIEENEVFAKYRRGGFTSQSERLLTKKDLPSFPSREHCIGIWRMNASPTGFEIEEGYENRSDNIILRVDGTIAGGPILDKETRQKASGGTWRLETSEPSRGELEVRLVVPPSKERILVMRGTIAQPFTSEVSLAGKSFGIPIVESRAKAANANVNDHCYGRVWIEDVVTRKKYEIGEFSMTKVSDLLNPTQFSITIPKNVGSLD